MKVTKVIISMMLTTALLCSGTAYQVYAEEITAVQQTQESTVVQGTEMKNPQQDTAVQTPQENMAMPGGETASEELQESAQVQNPQQDAGVQTPQENMVIPGGEIASEELQESMQVQNVKESTEGAESQIESVGQPESTMIESLQEEAEQPNEVPPVQRMPRRATARAASGLNLTVDIPSNIKGGQEVTFTMNATGGSGDYKYRIAAVLDSEMQNVYDVSWGTNSTYTKNNQFKFTFYASGTYYLRFSVIDMKTYQTKMTGVKEYPVKVEDPNYPSVEEIVNRIAAECQQVCSTDFEKALFLHDKILERGDYDYSYTYCSAEGVLARGKGTCESYHAAYVKLLNKVGIETGRITGNGHVWTAVKMDGQWYQVDSTWDDGGQANKGTIYEHMYFGLTDNIIGLIHSDHKKPVSGYESTALENNYFIKTGQIKQWSDPFVSLIRQNLAAGHTQFVLPVSSTMPDNYKNVIYNLVAYQLSKTDWNDMTVSVSYANNQLMCNARYKTEVDNGNNMEGGLSSDSLSGKSKFIALLYENTLGRRPGQSEIDHWQQELSNGKTGADVAYGFLFSVEFQNKNYSNADYVEHLYLSLMGRPSDAGGKAGWVKRLDDGMSRTYVFKQFINSQEFANLCSTYGIERGSVTLTEPRDENYNVTRFVARNYEQFLGRDYDADGLNYWSEPINDHTKSMQEIAFGFVFSPECINQNLSDSEFAAMLYRGCFDREGEQSGINYWVEKLQSDEMDRIDVFYGFANSQEFANMVQSYGL